MIETAVILAAGKGTRFGEMTILRPKGFIPVNGTPMVIRSIHQLIESGIKRIVIGTGYHKEQYEALKQIYPQVECCFSEHFADTNSMWTLANCAKQIGGGWLFTAWIGFDIWKACYHCFIGEQIYRCFTGCSWTKFRINTLLNLMGRDILQNVLQIAAN